MTERRPHWTDDLIEAVKDAISGYCFDHVEGPLYDDDVYPIIAAVEDWEKETFNAATEVLVERIQKAEAQVQAVREFCAATNPIRGELHMAALHGWDTAMEMVLQLLALWRSPRSCPMRPSPLISPLSNNESIELRERITYLEAKLAGFDTAY